MLSPTPSPPRKRQRLSSPTYDQHLVNLAQEDLDAVDEIEARLSQSVDQPSPRNSASHSHLRNDLLYHDDPENPFVSSSTGAYPTFASASKLPHFGFGSALNLKAADIRSQEYQRSPSPEEPPPEPDYDAWFNPAPVEMPIAFTPANFVSAVAPSAPGLSSQTGVGFMKASNNRLIVPSSTALEKAREKLKDIWSQDNNAATKNAAPPSPSLSAGAGFKPASTMPVVASPKRPAVRGKENTMHSPTTPSPAGFSRPAASLASPLLSSQNHNRPKPFKSPLLKQLPTSSQFSISLNYSQSPLNPNRTGLSSLALNRSQHPLSTVTTAQASTPRKELNNNTGFSATTRLSSRIGRSSPAPFVTPFKPGMKPGELGRIKHDEARATTPKHPVTPRTLTNQTVSTMRSPYKEEIPTFFNLKQPTNRKSLHACGLIPGQSTVEELESFGINYEELRQITPSTAIYYSFRTLPSDQLESTNALPPLIGASAAFNELLRRGCTLATKPWVDNHWSLILWKLAGLAVLDPKLEQDPATKKWCWKEVLRQLLYRYERELNRGKRPPLRLIVNGDAPPAFPLILCVSNITWSEGGITEEGVSLEPHPELEVTDGWYRLRAEVDTSMVRAVKKGAIAIGRKIGVAGAKLSSEKKDPMEILEAYNSTRLIIYGNSSHLVPWHTKLGFKKGVCISTLHSLSPDGGCVSAMELELVKIYPVAFIEFLEDEQGNKSREGPRNEAEEMKVNETWKKRRDKEATKLRSELEKKQLRYESYVERLERKAGSHFQPREDDYPPDEIDDFYDALEDPAEALEVLSRLSSNEAGWLALHIRRRLEAERETWGEEIEKELQRICPPRSVRSFRILIVKDVRSVRRPSYRTAQLTVWDVLNLSLSEGQPAGTFEVGGRYLVTNLNPTQQNAWMDRYDPDSEVYLCTRRDSRWTKIHTSIKL